MKLEERWVQAGKSSQVVGALPGGHRWVERVAWGPGLFSRKWPHVLARRVGGGGCPSPKRGCWLWVAPHAHSASRWTVQW